MRGGYTSTIMARRRSITILPQPDDTTCGPTCLHAVYSYYGDVIPLEDVIRQVRVLDDGGTLAVFLGCHALKRGYAAEINTCNLHIFDPTWFSTQNVNLPEKLLQQAACKNNRKLALATQGYLEFIELGGKIRFFDFSVSLIKKYLYMGIPILTGLSATYLYRSPREIATTNEYDDVRGEASGHFVVLSRYDKRRKRVLVADPYRMNPISADQYYHVPVNRLIHSILLGIVTYDSNMLIITAGERRNTGRKWQILSS